MTGNDGTRDKDLSDVVKGIESITTMLKTLTTCVERTEADMQELSQDRKGRRGDEEVERFALGGQSRAQPQHHHNTITNHHKTDHDNNYNTIEDHHNNTSNNIF